MDVLNIVGENYIEVDDCEVEIVENIVQDLNEPKLGDCRSEAHAISMVGDAPKFIDFVGFERFDSIINSNLVNIVNFVKAQVF